MIRGIAGWPAHLPLVLAIMGGLVLLGAVGMRSLKTVRSRITHTTRTLTEADRAKVRRQSWVVAVAGLLLLAFAGFAYHLHADSGFEQLMDAVDRGDVGEVRSLLATKDHAIVNWRRGEGGGRRDNRPVTFPLLVAAQRNQAEITRLLLDAGADPLPVDRERRTALHYAVRADTAVMKLLLDGGSSADGSDLQGKSPLHLAVASGEAAPVELLLSRGANVRAADQDNATPLHFAASAEVAALLCAYDAHPGWPDRSNATPAARASARGDAALAAFLSPESGPCVWLHTRPGTASATARATAVNEYRCEQLKTQSDALQRPRQAAACLELARALEKGDDELQADPTRARSVYERACGSGQPEGCAGAARLADNAHESRE